MKRRLSYCRRHVYSFARWWLGACEACTRRPPLVSDGGAGGGGTTGAASEPHREWRH